MNLMCVYGTHKTSSLSLYTFLATFVETVMAIWSFYLFIYIFTNIKAD